MKKKRLVVRNIFIVLAVLIAVVLFGARLYFRCPHMDYYKASEKVFKIPGLWTGFVPQGLDYDETEKLYLVAGYMNDGSCSPLYITGEDGEARKINLCDPNGADLVCHSCGVAVNGDYLYLAGGHNEVLFVYNYGEVKGTEDGGRVKAIDAFYPEMEEGNHISVDFVSVCDGNMYIGEFYKDPEYPVDSSHYTMSEDGEMHALLVRYPLSENSPGFLSEPAAVYSVPDLAQGMYLLDGKMYISSSWGVSDSKVRVYDPGRSKGDLKTMSFAGKEVPLTILDSTLLEKEITAPPMAEEIYVKDGQLYIINEAASMKYIFGKLTSSGYVYATALDELYELTEK